MYWAQISKESPSYLGHRTNRSPILIHTCEFLFPITHSPCNPTSKWAGEINPTMALEGWAVRGKQYLSWGQECGWSVPRPPEADRARTTLTGTFKGKCTPCNYKWTCVAQSYTVMYNRKYVSGFLSPFQAQGSWNSWNILSLEIN